MGLGAQSIHFFLSSCSAQLQEGHMLSTQQDQRQGGGELWRSCSASEDWESLPDCGRHIGKLIWLLHPSHAPNINFISDIGDILIYNALPYGSKAISFSANFKKHPYHHHHHAQQTFGFTRGWHLCGKKGAQDRARSLMQDMSTAPRTRYSAHTTQLYIAVLLESRV